MPTGKGYPEGFDESCGLPAWAMRKANSLACSMTGDRNFDVVMLASALISRATPSTDDKDEMIKKLQGQVNALLTALACNRERHEQTTSLALATPSTQAVTIVEKLRRAN